MRTYYIARKGSNSANQSMQEWMILGCTQGKENAEKIVNKIFENKTDITLYYNQSIHYLTKKEAKEFTGIDPDKTVEAWVESDEIAELLIPA